MLTSSNGSVPVISVPKSLRLALTVMSFHAPPTSSSEVTSLPLHISPMTFFILHPSASWIIVDGTNSLTITFEAIPINQFAVEDQMNSQDDNSEAQHTYNGSQLYAIIPVAVVVDSVDIAITDEVKIAKQYLPRTAFDFCTGTPTNPKEYFDLDGINIDEWKEQIFTSVHYKHLYNDDGYYLDLFTGINSSDKYMWFGFSDIYGVYSPMNVPLIMPFTSDTNYPDISISTIKRIDKADDSRLAEYLIMFTLDSGITNSVMYLSRATTGYISPVIYSKCFQLTDFVIVENFLFSTDSNGYLDEVISDNPITKLHFHNNSVLENDEINLLYVDTSTTPDEFVQVKNGIVGDGVGYVPSGSSTIDQDIGYYDDRYDTDLDDNIIMDIIDNSCQVDPLQTTMPNARTSQVQTFIGSSLYQFIKTSVYSLVMSYGRHALRFIPFSLINAHTEKNGAVSEYLTTQVIPIIYPILYTHKSSNAMAGLSVDAETHSGAHFFDPSKWFWDRQSQYFFARTISSLFNMHSQPYLLMPADDTYKSMVSSPESNAFEIILEGASTPYQAFYRAFAGSMLITTTQDLNNVGTPESVLYTKDAINVEFIRNKILYGKNQIIFNNLPAIESKKGLYSASTLYGLTSDTGNRISDIPFGTYTVFFTIAQYTIASDGYSTFVYMTDNNGTYCIGKVEGQCIYKPSICELGIVFSTLDSTTIRIFQITGTDIVPIKKIDESGAVAHQAFIPSIGDIVICTSLGVSKNYIKIYKLSKYGIVQLVASSTELTSISGLSVVELTSGAMIIFYKTIEDVEHQYVLITASTESEYDLESSEFYFPYEQGLRMVLMGIKLQFEDEDGNPEGGSQKTFDLTVTANGHTEVYSDTDIACGTEVVIKWNSVPVGSARYKIVNSSGILRNIKWLVYPLPLINETL